MLLTDTICEVQAIVQAKLLFPHKAHVPSILDLGPPIPVFSHSIKEQSGTQSAQRTPENYYSLIFIAQSELHGIYQNLSLSFC